MKTKDVLCSDLKSVGDSGKFSGYAAIFGNVDDGKDRVQQGAFKEIVRNRAGKVVTLYMHGVRDPIGLAIVGQDTKGLYFETQLELADPTARRAHTLMKAEIIDGMSIGFDVLENGATFTEDGIRELHSLKLWEISPVTFGMNPLARVEAVKHLAGEVKTVRDFEAFLRDVGGFDKARARALASGGWDALLKVRDEPADDEKILELIGTRLFQKH